MTAAADPAIASLIGAVIVAIISGGLVFARGRRGDQESLINNLVIAATTGQAGLIAALQDDNRRLRVEVDQCDHKCDEARRDVEISKRRIGELEYEVFQLKQRLP